MSSEDRDWYSDLAGKCLFTLIVNNFLIILLDQPDDQEPGHVVEGVDVSD